MNSKEGNSPNTNPLEKITTTRRGFMFGAAALGAGVLGLRFQPVLAESEVSAEALDSTGWNVPFVEGEPDPSGETIVREPISTILSSIRQVTANPHLNIRDAAAGNDIGDLLFNSAIRIKEDVPDPDNNDWALVSPLYTTVDPETGEVALKEEGDGYTALNLTRTVSIDSSGKFVLNDQTGKAVEIPLTANIIHSEMRDIEMPDIQSAESIALTTLFTGVGGGDAVSELGKDFMASWSPQEEDTQESEQLTSFKRAIFSAAIGALTESEVPADTSKAFDVGEVLGKNQLSMFVNAQNGSLDVVTAFKKGNEILFSIAHGNYQLSTSVEDLNPKFTNIGFTTWNGLVEAYGAEKAEQMAQSITAFEENAQSLSEEVNTLPESGVYLAGFNKFAPELPNSQTTYSRDGQNYLATSLDSNGKISRFKASIDGKDEISWIPVYESIDDLSEDAKELMDLQIDLYSKAFGIEGEFMNVRFEQLFDSTDKPFTIVLGTAPEVNPNFPQFYQDIPLLVSKLDSEGKLIWERATPANILGEKNNLPVSVQISKNLTSDTKYLNILKSDMNRYVIDTGFYWRWAEPQEGTIDPWSPRDINNLLSYVENRLGKVSEVTAMHMVFAEHNPDWLKEGNIKLQQGESKEAAYERLLRSRIGYLAKEYGDSISRWSVVNEPYFNGRTIGENWERSDVFHDVLGPRYIQIAFEEARKQLGEDATLIYNDTANQALKDRNNGLYSQLTIDNLSRIQGLVDIAGMQMHLNGDTPPTKAQIIQAMQTYALYTNDGVEVTEMDVDMSKVTGSNRSLIHANIVYSVAEACLESGVCRGLGLWDIGDKNSWREQNNPNADPTLFNDNYQPKPAYFALLKAGFNQLNKN